MLCPQHAASVPPTFAETQPHKPVKNQCSLGTAFPNGTEIDATVSYFHALANTMQGSQSEHGYALAASQSVDLDSRPFASPVLKLFPD